MPDINTYANDRLLDFIDAVHKELSKRLRDQFGDDWLDLGVRKHFGPDYFRRVEQMLNSPMRVVDMARQDEELYGIEHLWNIVNGNWQLFQEDFDDKARTQVYLSEITELRHNLAHRRNRHYLLRSTLFRIMHNCQVVLTALQSPQLSTFAEIVESLSSGGTPWGTPLDGELPPSNEMYSEFVGRPGELHELSQWLESDTPQVLIWGYGGVGKSALAYRFARDIRDGSSSSLMAVCWVSAKKTEYSDGDSRERSADFSDLDSFLRALWRALYGPAEDAEGLTPELVLNELREIPILLVVDDFDTISEDIPLTTFLLHSLRDTRARVIFTSRYRVPALISLEVPPFHKDDLAAFVRQRALYHSVDQESTTKRLGAIESVTGGYPLFLDDLIRHSAIFGLDRALEDWSQRKGDAARQYALQRQIAFLSSNSSSTGDVLIALSIANRSLTIVEISAVAGLTDDDAEAGIKELLRWRLVNHVSDESSEMPAFRMNNNTSRLVGQTFRGDHRVNTYRDSFAAFRGERVPEARRAAIAKTVSQVKSLARDGDYAAAEAYLLESMTGELENSADLIGVLGWLYSLQPLDSYYDEARAAFQKSHMMGSSKVDTYYHWATLERKQAERLVRGDGTLPVAEEDIAAQWRTTEEVALMGTGRCGASQVLYYLAGYGASREAKSKDLAKNFSYAEAAYKRAIESFENALTAPIADVAPMPLGAIYRGLALAYEGIRDFENLVNTLTKWRSLSGSDTHLESELRRLAWSYPEVMKATDL